MDEIPIFINMEDFRTQKASALQLSGGVADPWLFTAVLSALSDGSLLPPLLLFRGAACRLPEGFPTNVLLEARPQGFSDQRCQDVWINKVGPSPRGPVPAEDSRLMSSCPPGQVWRPHASARRSSFHLLIADIHRGHLNAAFRNRLGSLGTNVVFVPSGCSSCVQPLDVCVTPVLRDFLQVTPPSLSCVVLLLSPVFTLPDLCSPAGPLESAGLSGGAGRAGPGPAGSDPGLLAQRGVLHPELGDPLPAQVSNRSVPSDVVEPAKPTAACCRPQVLLLCVQPEEQGERGLDAPGPEPGPAAAFGRAGSSVRPLSAAAGADRAARGQEGEEEGGALGARCTCSAGTWRRLLVSLTTSRQHWDAEF